MNRLVTAPSFTPVLQKLQHNLPTGLLLVGESGSGLLTIARSLSHRVEDIVSPRDSKGEIDRIAGKISVDAIRDLYSQTRGKARHKSAIIIDDADKLTIQAQQAFLKLLEEPPVNTHFILTAHDPSTILSTIRSRVQTHAIPRITSEQSRLILSAAKLDDDMVTKLLFIAEGRPALLTRLASNQRERDRAITLVNDARTYVTGSSYDQLCVALRYGDRSDAINLIETSLSLLKYLVSKKPSTDIFDRSEKLISAMQRIASGGNVRLQLLAGVI